MEKISHIVRGNARVSSADAKGSSAVRPGVPSFGRPVGESPHVMERAQTTAARASAINNEMVETKKANSQDRVVQNMADQFFMTRIRRPEEEDTPIAAAPKHRASAEEADSEVTDELQAGESTQAESGQPSGYVPRGSYVNVHA